MHVQVLKNILVISLRNLQVFGENDTELICKRKLDNVNKKKSKGVIYVVVVSLLGALV